MSEPQRIGAVLPELRHLTTNTRTLKSVRHSPPHVVFEPKKPRDIDGIHHAIRDAIRDCTAGKAPWPLFVFGAVGSGKSCAALCLVDRVDSAKYWTEESLCQQAADSMMDRLWNSAGYLVTPSAFWSRIREAPLVVVDELAARTNVTDHRYATVKRLLDEREGEPLMLVSNVDPKELASVYDDRVASRALCGTVVRSRGTDRRMMKPGAA